MSHEGRWTWRFHWRTKESPCTTKTVVNPERQAFGGQQLLFDHREEETVNHIDGCLDAWMLRLCITGAERCCTKDIWWTKCPNTCWPYCFESLHRLLERCWALAWLYKMFGAPRPSMSLGLPVKEPTVDSFHRRCRKDTGCSVEAA